MPPPQLARPHGGTLDAHPRSWLHRHHWLGDLDRHRRAALARPRHLLPRHPATVPGGGRARSRLDQRVDRRLPTGSDRVRHPSRGPGRRRPTGRDGEDARRGAGGVHQRGGVRRLQGGHAGRRPARPGERPRPARRSGGSGDPRRVARAESDPADERRVRRRAVRPRQPHVAPAEEGRGAAGR